MSRPHPAIPLLPPQLRAIPHTLILEINDVSIPQWARPGPLDQAARTGSQTVLAPGVHNDRLQLTKPNRDARPGAAIDRLRS